MGLILKLALDHYAAVLQRQLLGIADLGHAQLLGNLRAYLCGVAVDGLTAGDDQIEPDLLQRRGDDGGGGIGVGAAELTGGQQIGLIRAHGQRFPQSHIRLGRAHAHHGNGAAHLLAQPQRGLQTGLVVMVDDAGHALADQGVGLGIQLYLGGIGNLLDANNDLHMLLPLLISASWNRK